MTQRLLLYQLVRMQLSEYCILTSW